MQQSLVLTVLGSDRTGIVDSLASTVSQHGASWEESQMARLAGQFAGLVKITCPEKEIEALTTALEGLSATGLRISVVRNASLAEQPEQIRYHVDVLGNDRPGILAEVSHALRSQNANIVEITTCIESAPESGHGIFHTITTVTLDSKADPANLTRALEDLSPDLQVVVS